MLLALDPGMNSPGVALFNGALVEAARVAVPGVLGELPDGARWLAVAREIATWGMRRGHITSVVFERPQWYARGKSKGDPNQLAGVAGVAACVVGLIASYHGISVFSPTPAEWIGQVSKVCPVCKGKAKKKCRECRGSAWETPRGRLIRKRLTADELALVPDQNDALDAVGLGLFQIGRLEAVRVFSNGRDGR